MTPTECAKRGLPAVSLNPSVRELDPELSESNPGRLDRLGETNTR